MHDAELRVEAVYEQQPGNVWFALDKPVTAGRVTNHTSKYWVLRPFPAAEQTWVLTATEEAHRRPAKHADDHNSVVAVDGERTKAFVVFTAYIHEIHA